MPRSRKRKAPLVEPIPQENKEDDHDFRNYLDSSSISPHFFCSICQDIYKSPERAPCGHSFCKECIRMWLKSNSSCPEDRKKLQVKDLHHDFILENIIGDQKVSCPFKQGGCSEISILSKLSSHVKSCVFNPSHLPDFLKPDQTNPSTCSVIDSYDSPSKNDKSDVYIPLKMRLFLAGGEKRSNLLKAFNKPQNETLSLKTICGLLDDE